MLQWGLMCFYSSSLFEACSVAGKCLKLLQHIGKNKM